MARKNPSLQDVLLKLFAQQLRTALKRKQITGLMLAVLAVLLIVIAAICIIQLLNRPRPTPVIVPPGDYLFCFWNVENLFDDVDDGLTTTPDQEFDDWFSENAADLQLKLRKHREVLLQLNEGKGPDILALAEVENRRAAELLMEELNQNLPEGATPYSEVAFKEVRAGRHIAPAIITRLPMVRDRTRQLGKKTDRILEARIVAGDKELIVIAAHWTSRQTDTDGMRRAEYADRIYGEFRAMYASNPKIDVLICGDFNDDPEDKSVMDHLHATGDLDLVRLDNDTPLLYNPFAGKDRRRFGTLYYRGWSIFDQIVVSPGMLDDEGWSCDPQSVRTINWMVEAGDSLRRPWAFGNRTDDPTRRGYSDHFPVTIVLSVHGDEQK